MYDLRCAVAVPLDGALADRVPAAAVTTAPAQKGKVMCPFF